MVPVSSKYAVFTMYSRPVRTSWEDSSIFRDFRSIGAVMVFNGKIINQPSGSGEARKLLDMIVIGEYTEKGLNGD